MRTRKAFLFAPLAPLGVIYLWTIAHFELSYAAIALVHPFVWVFALTYGLPALYLAELIFGLPVHYLLERARWNGRVAYAICGAAVGVAACAIWASIVRVGPLPLHRDVARMAFMGLAAGAVGGVAFRKIARGENDGAPGLTGRRIAVVLSPLVVLVAMIYVLVGRRYSWRE